MADDTTAYDAFGANLSNMLFFRLYQCTNMLHKTGTRALDQNKVTTQQWAVLGALSRPSAKGGMAVGDLAAFLMVSRQNLTGLLSRMEAQGLIERVVCDNDSRSRLIGLSAAGRHKWANEMQANIARFYGAALEGFSNTDKVHAIHYLDRLLSNFKGLDSSD